MEKAGRKARIIIDTNIVLSSLLKQEGYTQAVLSILLSDRNVNVIIPKGIMEEVNRNIFEISRRSGVPLKIIKNTFNVLLGKMVKVSEKGFIRAIEKSGGFVKHAEDSILAWAAMRHAPSIILTYNKKDFLEKKLSQRGVKVFTPRELMVYFNLELETCRKVSKKGGLIKSLSSLLLKRGE